MERIAKSQDKLSLQLFKGFLTKHTMNTKLLDKFKKKKKQQ